jgi:hypothetical protein
MALLAPSRGHDDKIQQMIQKRCSRRRADVTGRHCHSTQASKVI